MQNTSPGFSQNNNYARYQVIFAGMCSIILTVGISRFAYTPILPIMREEAGLSYLAGGWLATFNYIGYIIGAIVAASTNDLTKKFLFYRTCLILALISTIAMGLTEDLYYWVFWRMVGGFSSAAGLLSASGLILNWLIREGHRPELGLHFSGIGLGIVVSGVSIALMIEKLTWAEQWLSLGLLSVFFLVPAWHWIPKPVELNDQSTGEFKASPSRYWMQLALAAYFCAGFGYVVSATFIVSILEKMPLLSGKGSWIWVVIGAAAIPSTFIWDRVARAMNYLPALLLAYVLLLLSIIVPASTESPLLNIFAAILYGGTTIGIVSLFLTLIGRRFPQNPSKAMARLTLSYSVAQITAPAIAGFIADASGSYKGALIVAVVVMLIGIQLIYLLKKLELSENYS